MKTYSKIQNKTLLKLFFLISLIAQFSFINHVEVTKWPSYTFMMNCVEAAWNSTSECITISDQPPTCSPVISSTYEWRDTTGIWRPIPSSRQLCGCDVYEYLDVTPVCQVQGGNFILGGRQFNKCPDRCLTRTDFTFSQGSSNVVNYPACTQDLNCIEITPAQLLANGGSMTAYYRSNTPSGSVVTILRFTYNGLGLNCANINAQVVQRGKIYKHIFVRRTVTCGGGVTEMCEDDIDIPQVPDNCLLEAFINTVNLGSPCNSSGYSASTINLSTPATYQWKYNGTNISINYAPSLYCLAGRPFGTYCAEITDASGCMTEVCRVHQSEGCTTGVTIGQLGSNLVAEVTNCGPHMSYYQWARWDGVSWSYVGTNSNSYNTGGLAGDYRIQVTCGPCMAYGNIVLAAPLLAGPLPVVLQKFEALADPCGPIQLTWNTVSEQNSREFVIERSMDGKQFDKICHVMSHNKSSGSNYTYIDSEAQNKSDKTIFYRLRHYDFDGTENIHKVIRHYYMCSDAIPSLSVSPNPAANLITIYVTDAKNEDEVSIIIRSIHGSIVKTANLSEANQEQQINISQLPAGIYSVEAKGKYLKTTTVFTKVD